jgi:hypothetical protein
MARLPSEGDAVHCQRGGSLSVAHLNECKELALDGEVEEGLVAAGRISHRKELGVFGEEVNTRLEIPPPHREEERGQGGLETVVAIAASSREK